MSINPKDIVDTIYIGYKVIKEIIKYLPSIKTRFGKLSISPTIIISFREPVPLFSWKNIVRNVLSEHIKQEHDGSPYLIVHGTKIKIISIDSYCLPPLIDIDKLEEEIELYKGIKLEGQKENTIDLLDYGEPLVKRGYIVLGMESADISSFKALKALSLRIAETFQSYAIVKLFIRIYSKEEEYRKKKEAIHKLTMNLEKHVHIRFYVERIKLNGEEEPFIKIPIVLSQIDLLDDIPKLLKPPKLAVLRR